MDQLLSRKKCTLGIGPMTNKLTKQANFLNSFFFPTLHKIKQYCRLPPAERHFLRDSSFKAELQRLSGSIYV